MNKTENRTVQYVEKKKKKKQKTPNLSLIHI